ncbi:MAG: hypothetical protein KDI36_05800 [Pseudomonadales bacterium]|nr:hypothetical protein [Pseudomonadales bacterium]
MSHQQVNLYSKLGIREYGYNASLISAGLLTTTVLSCVLFWGWLQYQTSRDNDSQTALAQRNQVLQQQATERSGAVRDELSAAQAQLAELTAEQTGKQALLAALDHAAPASASRFSAFMTGLARQYRPGLTLTQVTLSDQGQVFAMAGMTDNPARLPAYLQRLGQETAFRTMLFNHITLDEQDDAVHFRVNSVPADAVPTTVREQGS